MQITFVSRGHHDHDHFFSQHALEQPTIPDEPSACTSESSAHASASARPTTGRARRATVSMLVLYFTLTLAYTLTRPFSARPSETGRSSGFFLSFSIRLSEPPCMIMPSNAHWSVLGGRTSASASEAPHPALTAAPLLLPQSLSPMCPPASTPTMNAGRAHQYHLDSEFAPPDPNSTTVQAQT